MATKNSSDSDDKEPTADFSTITTDEMIDELKNRFKMFLLFGVPNEGEEYDTRASYKVEHNVYEVFGMLEVAKDHFRQGLLRKCENVEPDDEE